MRVCSLSVASHPFPSDTLRHGQIPAGMGGLRHKSRHKNRATQRHEQSREQSPATLQAAVLPMRRHAQFPSPGPSLSAKGVIVIAPDALHITGRTVCKRLDHVQRKYHS